VAKELKKTKYVKALFSIPDNTYLEFKKLVPPGIRSQLISRFIKKYVTAKTPKKEKGFWDDIGKYIKGDYSNEDPVKTQKNAWKGVINRY